MRLYPERTAERIPVLRDFPHHRLVPLPAQYGEFYAYRTDVYSHCESHITYPVKSSV